MTQPSYDATAYALEQRAEQAEHSPIPIFLKVGRVLVWIMYVLVLLTAILLSLAFLLRLFGANPGSAFVDWVYRNAEYAMRPFRGIFPTHDIGGSSVVDLSLLFAALVYFVLALLFDIAVRWLTHRVQRREAIARDLRAQADEATQFAASQHYAADVAAREAAAREYAAQQAAAQQYAIAHAAAQDVIAAQSGRPTAPAEPPRPSPPTAAAEPPRHDLPPPVG